MCPVANPPVSSRLRPHGFYGLRRQDRLDRAARLAGLHRRDGGLRTSRTDRSHGGRPRWADREHGGYGEAGLDGGNRQNGTTRSTGTDRGDRTHGERRYSGKNGSDR